MLVNKQVDKIIITRPMVEVGTKMGAMPGDVEDKMSPFIGPIIEQFYELRAKEEIDKMIKDGKIEIVAL
jgi:phosphate starvation-inducible PhoH-like protein